MKKIITTGVVFTLLAITGVTINQKYEVFQFSFYDSSEDIGPVKNPTIINKETTQKIAPNIYSECFVIL